MTHAVKLGAMHVMSLQLLNKNEEFVPFRVIKWSTECRIFRLAIYLVTVKDAMNLDNVYVVMRCIPVIRMLTAVVARDNIPLGTRRPNSSCQRFPS